MHTVDEFAGLVTGFLVRLGEEAGVRPRGVMHVIGQVYTRCVRPKGDQVLTRWDVAEEVAQAGNNAGDLEGRLEAATARSPAAHAAMLAGDDTGGEAESETRFLERVLPPGLSITSPF